MTLRKGNSTVSLDVGMQWYLGSDGNTTEDQGLASGAYIFRPDGPPTQMPEVGGVDTADGPLLGEVHKTFSDWASVTIR